MRSPNWLRIALCGFVTGVICHLLSVASLAILAPDFYPSVRQTAPYPSQGGAFFFAIDVLMGVWAVWLYSSIAPRYGEKLSAAAMAAVAWWTLKTLQSAKWVGLGYLTLGPRLLPLGVATLGATVVALAVGAWMYTRAGVVASSGPMGAEAR